ncbi:erythromycin esterase family protein [Actinomadura luteofluorescens]|uniref:erythromycin esterase family protein n=1 Tax=Actinomadura luteofluorescens TaxID=46163 RepID=UPI00349576B2
MPAPSSPASFADYVALALTSVTGHTADMRPDENARFGFAVDATALQPPEPGSVEAAFAEAGLGLSIADLSRFRTRGSGDHGPDRVRIQSTYVETPVLDAFDAVISTPTSTVADDAENSTCRSGRERNEATSRLRQQKFELDDEGRADYLR